MAYVGRGRASAGDQRAHVRSFSRPWVPARSSGMDPTLAARYSGVKQGPFRTGKHLVLWQPVNPGPRRGGPACVTLRGAGLPGCQAADDYKNTYP
jgi:hypothetical protein